MTQYLSSSHLVIRQGMSINATIWNFYENKSMALKATGYR